MRTKRTYWLILFFLGILASVGAQSRPVSPVSPTGTTPVADTARNQKVDIINADLFQNIQSKDSTILKLGGNVELKQDSIFMFCDTAIIINETMVIAYGDEVLIQQGDSLSVFSDSLFYDGTLREAQLFGTDENPVILLNGEQQIFTKRLHYDLNTKVATYRDKAILTNGQTQMSSKRGYYYVQTDEAFFKDSVVVIDPEFELKADTLKFGTKTKIVTFLGPTRISNDSTRVYCESGFYNTDLNVAEFRKKAQFVKGAQQATADTIRYDGQKGAYVLNGNAVFREDGRLAKADVIRYQEESEETVLTGNAYYRDDQQEITSEQILYDAKKEIYSTRGRSVISDPPQILIADQVDYSQEEEMGIALGNVIWRDTSENISIECAQANYNQKTGYLKAIGNEQQRPMLITLMQGDSLYLSADTLFSIREEQPDSISSDSSRMFLAFADVRIFKSDLQAVCDSLVYSSTDSLFHFYKDPVIWSDTSQFTADTIYMQLANEALDRIYLREQAFIINSPDEIFFNQVKGKNVTAQFREGELRVVDVQGNAESVYYALDEVGAYIGVNKTICSEMRLFFGNNEVKKIAFFTEPTATMYPMQQANDDELELSGFRWQVENRPKGILDIVRPGRREAPLSPEPAAPKPELEKPAKLLGTKNMDNR